MECERSAIEIYLVYNRDDNHYYVYDGETYVSDNVNLADALQYFLALVTGDVETYTEEYPAQHMRITYGKEINIQGREE